MEIAHSEEEEGYEREDVRERLVDPIGTVGEVLVRSSTSMTVVGRAV